MFRTTFLGLVCVTLSVASVVEKEGDSGPSKGSANQSFALLSEDHTGQSGDIPPLDLSRTRSYVMRALGQVRASRATSRDSVSIDDAERDSTAKERALQEFGLFGLAAGGFGFLGMCLGYLLCKVQVLESLGREVVRTDQATGQVATIEDVS